MNNLKTIILAGSFAFFSMSSLADTLATTGQTSSQTRSAIVEISAEQTKQQAYQQAMSKLKRLQASSPLELSNALQLLTLNQQETKSLHLKSGNYITVEERMNERGAIEYFGQVNVIYHFSKEKN